MVRYLPEQIRTGFVHNRVNIRVELKAVTRITEITQEIRLRLDCRRPCYNRTLRHDKWYMLLIWRPSNGSISHTQNHHHLLDDRNQAIFRMCASNPQDPALGRDP